MIVVERRFQGPPDSGHGGDTRGTASLRLAAAAWDSEQQCKHK